MTTQPALTNVWARRGLGVPGTRTVQDHGRIAIGIVWPRPVRVLGDRPAPGQFGELLWIDTERARGGFVMHERDSGLDQDAVPLGLRLEAVVDIPKIHR